jgi:hypothetical protein
MDFIESACTAHLPYLAVFVHLSVPLDERQKSGGENDLRHSLLPGVRVKQSVCARELRSYIRPLLGFT